MRRYSIRSARWNDWSIARPASAYSFRRDRRMTAAQIIREARRALIGAALALSLLFQLVLGTVASAAHAADRVQGLDRLGVLCSVSEGRTIPNGTAPERGHHSKDTSGCCTWGGNAQPTSLLLPPVSAFLGAFDASARIVAFVRAPAIHPRIPLAFRRQAPRAPPIQI